MDIGIPAEDARMADAPILPFPSSREKARASERSSAPAAEQWSELQKLSEVELIARAPAASDEEYRAIVEVFLNDRVRLWLRAVIRRCSKGDAPRKPADDLMADVESALFQKIGEGLLKRIEQPAKWRRLMTKTIVRLLIDAYRARGGRRRAASDDDEQGGRAIFEVLEPDSLVDIGPVPIEDSRLARDFTTIVRRALEVSRTSDNAYLRDPNAWRILRLRMDIREVDGHYEISLMTFKKIVEHLNRHVGPPIAAGVTEWDDNRVRRTWAAHVEVLVREAGRLGYQIGRHPLKDDENEPQQ